MLETIQTSMPHALFGDGGRSHHYLTQHSDPAPLDVYSNTSYLQAHEEAGGVLASMEVGTCPLKDNESTHFPAFSTRSSLFSMAFPAHGQQQPSLPISTTYENSKSQSSTRLQMASSSVSPMAASTHVPLDPAETTEVSASNADGTAIPSLRIPSTIRTPQGRLPQLAAEITCLFWFEDASALERILDPSNQFLSPLEADSMPSIGFRKWVSMILSTTQVTANVILLALLFIYRLKTTNPTVKGKSGSEFRLLTVALMLGNKFLDDNTYTNKTWAEVSGISVKEVHVMEVEFLSNMRYSLFCSKEDWNKWHAMLGTFGTYFQRASRLHEEVSRTSSFAKPGLAQQVPSPHALVGPPASLSSQTISHASATTLTPHLMPVVSSTAMSPIGPLPETGLQPVHRKRSHDEVGEQPAPKRFNQHGKISAFQQSAYPTLQHMRLPEPQTASNNYLPRLPALTVQTTFNQQPQPHHALPQLPLPGRPSMGLVFPNTAQASLPASQVPSLTTTPVQNFQRPHFDTPHQLSPYTIGSDNSSPLSAPHQQSRLSPSFFLQSRSSPYRPVRPVNHLLVPPPSAAFTYNAPRRVPLDQMQYRPLGRPMADTQIGHLPYHSHQAWPSSYQLNQWPTPSR